MIDKKKLLALHKEVDFLEEHSGDIGDSGSSMDDDVDALNFFHGIATDGEFESNDEGIDVDNIVKSVQDSNLSPREMFEINKEMYKKEKAVEGFKEGRGGFRRS